MSFQSSHSALAVLRRLVESRLTILVDTNLAKEGLSDRVMPMYNNHLVAALYVGQMSIGQMSIGQMSIGQMSIGQMSIGQMFFDQMSLTKSFSTKRCRTTLARLS